MTGETLNLRGARAFLLHRPHATTEALTRQLRAIGLRVDQAWPECGPEAPGADFIFFDADMGYDEQFPWQPGTSPMPMIALIGSEAPGRIAWSLRVGAHAQLVKPVGDSGVYAALQIARVAFDAQQRLHREIGQLRARLDARETVVQAVVALAGQGKPASAAFDQLRQLAMAWRVTIEEAAHRIVAAQPEDGDDRRDLR